MISINGVKYQGNNVSIKGGVVTIDGKSPTPVEDYKTITVVVHGNLQALSLDEGSVKVEGDVGNIKTVNGGVQIKGDVVNVQTVNGNVDCGDVSGPVNTINGNIRKNG